MIWRTLGIKETRDKKVITRAYRDRLISVNPEEKPEEFKELRAAYEKALKLAEQQEVPARDKSELELWTDELADIYNNFQARIDVDAWRDLMSREICQGLDTRPEVGTALLNFLMDHYQMSQKVMQYLEEEFGFSEHLDELMEHFPRDFVEFILVDAVRYGESLPLELFQPGFDAAACDAYVALYNKARQVPVNEAGDLYEKMAESPETHPYGEALLLKASLYADDFSVIPKLQELTEEWPEDEHLAFDLALAYKMAGDSDRVSEVCENILQINPTHFGARQYLAEAEAMKGHYKTAIQKLNQLLQESTGDSRVMYELDELRRTWNDIYSVQLKETLDANPEDHKTRFDLIWSYIENNRMDEAYPLLEMLPVGQPDDFSFYNLQAVAAETKGDNESAVKYLQKLLEITRNLQPDGTEKTELRMKRVAEIMVRIAADLSQLRRYDEAEEMMELALAENSEDMGLLLHMTQIALNIRKYEKTEALADIYIRNGPRNAIGYYMKASACFRMGNDSQAFQLVNTALDLDGSDLNFYLLKLRILMRNRAFEAADSMITFLEENGITDNPTVNFCKFQKYILTVKEYREEELEEVFTLAEHIDGQLNPGAPGNPFWAPDFYYHYGRLLDRNDRIQEALHYYEILLAEDEKNADYHFYAGMCCLRMDRFEEARQHFQREQELEPNDIDGFFRMTFTLQKMNLLDEALEQARKTVEMSKKFENDNTVRFYRPLIRTLRRMNEPDEAIRAAWECAERNPDWNVDDEIISILCQFGRFAQAEAFVKDMKNRRKNRTQTTVTSLETVLMMLQNKVGMLKSQLTYYKNQIDEELLLSAKLLLAIVNNDYRLILPLMEQSMEEKIRNNEVDTSSIYSYIRTLWMSGQEEKARREALKFLDYLNLKVQKTTSPNRLIDQTKRAWAMAVAGEIEEARGELEHLKQEPMCENCVYCRCKDAELFLCDVELFAGNYEKGLAMAQEGLENWPDDEDFLVAVYYAKNKLGVR